VHTLERRIRDWITAWNEIPKLFVCTNIAEEILESIGTINETNQRRGHTSPYCCWREMLSRQPTTSAVQQGF
jgi:hypothetical protein